MRDKAEEYVDNIHIEEIPRISLELAEMAEELADQWDALALNGSVSGGPGGGQMICRGTARR